jgi:peptidoglycan/LPS O-acetylase OafA/YrhL
VTLGHHRGLDGLRALAVVGVLLFHANVSWMDGGFLGVDIFFVLSGFLITRLLLDERGLTGAIGIGRFYARRALRLFPALALLLAAVLVYAQVHLDAAQASRALHDAFATATYHMNWRLALVDRPPFGRFDHAWSLAIEEQFYLAWPVLLVVLYRRWGARGIAWAAACGVVVSAGVRVLLTATGTAERRVYYGLDAHADGLLLGAMLAALTVVIGVPELRRRLPSWAGGAAMAVIAFAFVRFVRGSTFVDTAGLLLVEAAAAVVVLDVVGGGMTTRLLDRRALVAIGLISYGVYLWHWPVYLAITAGEVSHGDAALLTVRLAATFSLAALSYWFVERPFLARQRRFRVSAADAGATPGRGRPTT